VTRGTTVEAGKTNKAFWPWELDPEYTPHQRASALYGARTCNASVFLAQSLKLRQRDTSTAYTNVGTIGHKWLELRILFGPEIAADYLKKNIDAVPPDFPQSLDELWDWLTGESGLLMEGAEYLTEQTVAFQAGTCLITGHVDLVQVLRSLGVVIDWKFYNDLSYLPPIKDDLQMYSYGVGASLLCPEIEHIEVHRVACYHLKSDMIQLDNETLDLAWDAIEEEANKIWENRTTFSPGAQCLTCLLRRSCPAYAAQEAHIDTTEIVPYRSGELASAEEVIRFMVAKQQVEERLEKGVDACKRWVQQNGPVKDPQTGKLWKGWESKRDTILDPAAALGQLGKRVGSIDLALKAAKTTKSGMEGVMKLDKIKSKERTAFFKSLRELGIMEKRETEPRWEWRAPKE
jgi:hypothetical protein